jgi:Tol biopolymer transport system component
MRASIPVFLAIITLVACQDNSKQPAEAKQLAQYTIDQFYKTSHLDGGDFSSDEKKLLLSSDESGIYNVYELDVATGQKKALTHSK